MCCSVKEYWGKFSLGVNISKGDIARQAIVGTLSNSDPEVAAAVQLEIERQRNKLVLIAAENYASRAVLEAQGSPLTNKYAAILAWAPLCG